MTVLLRPQGLTALLMGRFGNALLWLFAALHLAALSILLMTLLTLSDANAAEQQADACGGSNILVAMQKTDPQAYAAILAEAEKIPNGEGTLWKIEKDGKDPSWLLGTMHLADPRVVDMPKGAKEAFAKAKTVIVESDEITSEKKAGASLLARPDLTMFVDGKSITDMLSADDVAKLETGLKERGIPLNAVIKMKPWILSSFVALPACELARKAKGAEFLDMKLANDALKEGKQLVGLETLVEQMSALSDLPMTFHVQSLIEMLRMGNRMQDIMATMIDLYLKGEIGMVTPMMKSIDPDENNKGDDGYAAFEQRLITDRNHVMADRAQSHLDQGGVFMAVGALHLPGNEGVIELLRKKGFTLTRVN